mmetsp:Transcript_15124/g.63824  ORF Transcript_15124/g.63824 Transcript_15124/m.63824 type:complete len:218 (+) Transcript_15124:568-1221(+)
MVVPMRAASALSGFTSIPAGCSRIKRGNASASFSSTTSTQNALRTRSPASHSNPRSAPSARAASRSSAREKRFTFFEDDAFVIRVVFSVSSSSRDDAPKTLRAAKTTFTGVSTVHDVTGPISRESATANDSAPCRAFEPRTPLKQLATTTPPGATHAAQSRRNAEEVKRGGVSPSPSNASRKIARAADASPRCTAAAALAMNAEASPITTRRLPRLF